jgi:hypothetical protein
LKIKRKGLSYHPLNLAVRFVLELICLLGAGLWGYNWSGSSYLVGIAIPVVLMVVWAVCAVPGDRSRSGNAPVPIPGALRLLLELSFFGFGTWAFYDLDMIYICLIFGVAVLAHYLISHERVFWLMKQ